MKERFAHHPRIRHNVKDTGGDGPIVILIHDYPLTQESVQAHVPALTRAGCRVISYDRRGFGGSEKTTDGYDYWTLGLDLVVMIVEMNLRDVRFVGFGMGAAVMLHAYDLMGDDNCKGLTFVSTVTPYMLEAEGNPNGWLSPGFYEAMRESLRTDRRGFFTTLMNQYYSVDGQLLITPQQLQDLVRECETSDENAALRCFESLCTTDHREHLRRVQTPTTIIHGAGDDFAPEADSAVATQSTINDGMRVSVEDAPHGLNLTHLEAFNDLLVKDVTTRR